MCFFVRFRLQFSVFVFRVSVFVFLKAGEVDAFRIQDPAASPGGFTRRRLTKALTVSSQGESNGGGNDGGVWLTTAFNQSILNGNQAGSLN